ncbi:MAG: hypothetical protein RIC55_36185 [Pirellulaceae bacterium]
MLNLTNLTPDVRLLMTEEIESDIGAKCLYRCSRLTDDGWRQYPDLLLEAAELHNDAWLANQIRARRLLAAFEFKRGKLRSYQARVPVTAAETLAEGEFNRFYIRGLCRYALSTGVEELVVYRAKRVTNPRPGSAARIGTAMCPQAVLDDLRRTDFVETALGMPQGPNSGLSLQLPADN